MIHSNMERPVKHIHSPISIQPLIEKINDLERTIHITQKMSMVPRILNTNETHTEINSIKNEVEVGLTMLAERCDEISSKQQIDTLSLIERMKSSTDEFMSSQVGMASQIIENHNKLVSMNKAVWDDIHKAKANLVYFLWGHSVLLMGVFVYILRHLH